MLAAFFGAFGWALGGPQTASVFVFCTLLAALAVYAYADRALLGMLGAREYALAEDPLLRSTVDALAAKFGVVPPKLYLIPDGYPRALSAGRGPAGSAVAFSTGPARRADAGRARGRDRARARARAPPRRPDADVRGDARGRPGRSLPDRRLVRACAAGVPRPDRGSVRPPTALAAARAGGRPDGVGAARLRRRPRRRAPEARPRQRPRLVPGEPGDGAAVHREPVRRGGTRRALRHAPAAARRLAALHDPGSSENSTAPAGPSRCRVGSA